MALSKFNDPAGGSPAAADTQRLEEKIAQLEQGLQQTLAVNEKMIAAVSQAVAKAARAEQNLTAYSAHQAGLFEQAFTRIGALEQRLDVLHEIEALAKVSRMHPKTRTVIFIGRNNFGDNIKYAFLAFSAVAKNNDIACYFWTDKPHQYRQLKDAGLPCLPPAAAEWSYDDAKIFLSAKVAVLCDNFHRVSHATHIPYALLQGARFVQIWHGAAFKRIGFQHLFSPAGNNVFLSTLLASCGVFDVLIGSNAASKDEWKQLLAFNDFAPLGYPRNDVFFREPTALDMINVDIATFTLAQEARRTGKPVILYAPTFRDHMGPDWFERIGIDAVADHCRAQGYIFCVNLHPFEQIAVEELRQRHPKVHFIAPYTDIYPLMKEIDILVTDYSSLAFDFLHLDRPMVFFRPDHAEYVTKARGLMEDRQAYTPGEVPADIPALMAAMDAAVTATRQPDADPFRAARQSLRQQLFDHHDGRAADRLVSLIMERIEAK